MAKTKTYTVIAEVGVVGFNGVIHAKGETITSATVPAANLKAWLRFGQIEEVAAETDVPTSGKPKKEGK